MRKLLGTASVIFVDLLPLAGVIYFGWTVAGIFFWYWVEFLVGWVLAYSRLRNYWKSPLMGSHVQDDNIRKNFWPGFLVSMAFVTFLTLGPVMNEIVGGRAIQPSDYNLLFGYVAGNTLWMVIILAAALIGEWSRGHDRFGSANEIMKPLVAKTFVLGLFYLILIVQYHATGAQNIPTERWYLLFEIAAFVIARALIDSVIYLRRDLKIGYQENS